MRFAELHAWDLSPKEAVALQQRLAAMVDLRNRVPEEPRLVAGVDVSYRKNANLFHAAVVVLSWPELTPVETASASGPVDFPYVPGLLSFRELPILLRAFRGVQSVPDVVLVDGQGVAHPRRFGLACHLGLWLGLPTVGCAKSRLCGEFEAPALERGARTALLDRGERLGAVVRTRDRVRPLFVSPGHRVDFDRAVALTLQCGRGYRLPEPTRQAHLASNRLRLESESAS